MKDKLAKNKKKNKRTVGLTNMKFNTGENLIMFRNIKQVFSVNEKKGVENEVQNKIDCKVHMEQRGPNDCFPAFNVNGKSTSLCV